MSNTGQRNQTRNSGQPMTPTRWFDTPEQARAACPGVEFVTHALVHDGRFEPFRRYWWMELIR